MTKLERLLNLIAALIHTVVPMTADEIREEVEGYGGTNDASFHRAFERDKDELRAMGVPISVGFVPGTDPPLTGYRIDGQITMDERGGFAAKPGTRADPLVRAWELGDGDPIDARVLVDADQALWSSHHVGTDAVVETRPDGSVVLALTVRNRDAFRS